MFPRGHSVNRLTRRSAQPSNLFEHEAMAILVEAGYSALTFLVIYRLRANIAHVRWGILLLRTNSSFVVAKWRIRLPLCRRS
jgi:hypothetical protein